MTYTKPETDIDRVLNLLQRHWNGKIGSITPIEGGNLSRVYYVDYEGKPYVVRCSSIPGSYRTEAYVSRLLSPQGVPYPRIVHNGADEELLYAISERVEGSVMADLPLDRKQALLPELVTLMTRMNQVDCGYSTGFGWIGSDGNGMYDSWQSYIDSFYAEEQPADSFWFDWHELFRTTFLERSVFEECYARLQTYAPYNAQHRHFVHNDCHAWNLMSDGRTITGIIDGNCIYGDYMIDLSIAESVIPGVDTVSAVQEAYERQDIEIPNFKERLLGARYYKGLDGLRFYAKMDRRKSYDALRSFLLGLES